MSVPTNHDVAAALHELADHLASDRGELYRARAYRRAAESIESLDRSVCGMSPADLVRLPGVGKGVAARVEEICRTGRIEALDALRGKQKAMLLAHALPRARDLVGRMRHHPAVVEAAVAGSVRRMCEVVGDIDVVVATDNPGDVESAFGEQGVDLHVVSPPEFAAGLQRFTGSAAHNAKLRTLGDFQGDTEEDIYRGLGLPPIPPTLREDRGEIEAGLAGALPRVVELGDIRGDLQSHSTYSDGRLSVREMAMAAAAKGYEYFAVTDHGPRLTYMQNLGLPEIARQRDEVAEVNAELGGRMRLLHGIELNIGPDGSLDYPDDVLSGFDLCVASVHSSFKLSRKDQTKRLVKAISNQHVHVVGHPSGRRLDRREGIDFDLAEVAEAGAAHQVALEINAHPFRLDLRDTHVLQAREHGVTFVVSTDAHSAAELDNMEYGVATAQRGWATPSEVLNTRPLDGLLAFLAEGRG